MLWSAVCFKNTPQIDFTARVRCLARAMFSKGAISARAMFSKGAMFSEGDV